MPLCPNGSGVNPSAPAFRWITWIDSQSWLGTFFSKFSFLSFLIEPLLVQTSVFCATEPPQPVYPGDATVVSAATNPAAFETVLTYLKQSAVWFAWSQVCQCNASGTPGCQPLLWSHAANLPNNFDWDPIFFGKRFQSTIGGLSIWGVYVDARVATPGQIYWRDIPTTANAFQPYTFTPGWHYYGFPTPRNIAISTLYEVGIRVSNGASGTKLYYNTASAPSYSSPLADGGWYDGPYDFSTSTPITVGIGIDPAICVGAPGVYPPAPPVVPPTSLPDIPTATCTTVSDLCTLVNPLIDQTALLKQRLDLLQRRLLPFAWITGTPSTGLTGHGTIAVQDALGVIVNFTAIPAKWGITYENPSRYIPALGMLRAMVGTPGDNSRLLHYHDQIVMFEAPWATSIHYDFPSGVTASLTPIYPEP